MSSYIQYGYLGDGILVAGPADGAVLRVWNQRTFSGTRQLLEISDPASDHPVVESHWGDHAHLAPRALKLYRAHWGTKR